MSNKDKILSSITHATLCDDCLSNSANVKPRQTVYSICRSPGEASIIKRYEGVCEHCHKSKIINQFLNEVKTSGEKLDSLRSVKLNSENTPWYWEGNVQSKVVRYLVLNGYTIHSVADTISRSSGKDIIASKSGSELWISVKGYPQKSQHIQARHWFSNAIFDLLLYHDENPEAQLGIALPVGFTTYKNLIPRINWLKNSMPFQFFWVDEFGNVQVE
ncbi:hypothetical protein BK138_32005 [Paenibacillus rhizosphaerae]|uniref:Uncharacterized protein n=1 Tax=Paenibacillus rhizosphaerae TaxID=297318 RepID=A0A1R1E612_9BACL|nr:hypothetical protein [Paenibacillus rhizosphaerae]OMF47264.1 hypothetical protein BK138_32005 [Paenibacillus rhizosphaerae]